MKWFSTKDDKKTLDFLLQHKATRLHISELAIEKAKTMIAQMIAKSEIQVYRNKKGKIVQTVDDVYYKLNVKPNDNYVASDFWFEVLDKMFDEDEALVVILNNKMYLADSYQKSEDVLYPKYYSDVVVDGYRLEKEFNTNEVMLFPNQNKKIRKLIRAFNRGYAEMLDIALKSYKRTNLMKYSLDIDTLPDIYDKETKKPITDNDYSEKIKKQLDSEELEVILAGRGINLNELGSASGGKNADDLAKITEQIFRVTAWAFNIPENVFLGKLTEKSNAVNDMITFAISPICEVWNDVFNSTIPTIEEYKRGEKILINQTRFKHVDILDASYNADKLFAQGFTHDEISKFLGLEPTGEAWANKRFVTKNYSEVLEKGGSNE